MTKCAVLFCKNYSSKTANVSYHPFPVDPLRKRKWVEAVRRKQTWIPTKHHRICGIHFESKFYSQTATKQRKLYKNAFPTLQLPECSYVMENEQEDVEIFQDKMPDEMKASTPAHSRETENKPEDMETVQHTMQEEKRACTPENVNIPSPQLWL